jgi:hypothetical protein
MLSTLFHNRSEHIENTFIEVKKPKIIKTSISLFYDEYIKNKTVLKKYKLPELKQIAKSNR